MNKRSMASRAASDSSAGIELVVPNVRDLPLPRRAAGAITPTEWDDSEFANDRRSSLADTSEIVEASVVAADLAHNIQEQTQLDLRAIGHLDPETVRRKLPNYNIHRLCVDHFSGLKAFALESRHSHHRIYAIAGIQVFVNRDYRDWASGLMMARPQFVSNASLLLVNDAADYALGPEHGGEFFFTGQSQGAIVSSGARLPRAGPASPRPRRRLGVRAKLSWKRSNDPGMDVDATYGRHWSVIGV